MTIFRQAGFLIVAAIMPALLSAVFHPRRPAWVQTAVEAGTVVIDEVDHWTGAVLWLDARSEAAYAREHVPGALPLNEGRWEEQFSRVVERWRPGMKLVVYCDSRDCDSSAAVARRLRRELGVGDVYVLQDGWAGWRKSRNP